MELADLIFLMERYGDNDAKCSSFLFGFGGVMWDPCLVRRCLVNVMLIYKVSYAMFPLIWRISF